MKIEVTFKLNGKDISITTEANKRLLDVLREDLHFHSIRDPLTGLYNRRFMEHVFENEMRRTMRRKHSLSVMMMDVDHFKTVNDALGHEVGDQMLKAIANYLSSRMPCRLGEKFSIRYWLAYFFVMLF